MIEKKIKENNKHFCIYFATFSRETETGLDTGLDEKI